MRYRQLSGRRRAHATPAQRARTVRRFQRSGLSRAEFARRQGLVLSTLDRWLGEARHAPQGPPAVAFSEMRLASPLLPGAASAWAVEIVSPKGLTVRWREPLAAPELVRLLRSLSC